VIRGVVLGADRAGPVRDLSPPGSDAEMPRVAAFGHEGRHFVVWTARRQEAIPARDASPEDEATGEARVPSWLEAVVVDGAGATVGPVRTLTSPSGYVSAYDMQILDGEPRPTLLVVARDDGEAVDGSGGTLFRVRAGADFVEPPVAFTHDGLGRGAPVFIADAERAAAWLSWVGPAEHLRLLALDAAGAPQGLPSAEEGMDEARPVLGLRSGHLLVAAPGDAARPLRTFSCLRR
ncbi:MAG: hypothetical protein ACRENE_18600, partial [Polyangiaceae bacterium]